ncbi:zinc-finger of a C2HC-type [Novymonas esmeraldas]|uniref:Zinc-finger of a C2HC-type n=1 Tax=Novymonas esmeraldas TaxID=1808958 RepID=A0AAW0EP51_9TRYP
MSTARRSTTPSGLGSNTSSATARRVSAGDGGSGMIVTRGLQELLESERKHRRPEEATPTSAATPAKSKTKGQRRSAGQAPNFVICYLCGRQFGTASIDIHRPQCYLKRLIVWERGEAAIRGPKPLNPEEHEKMMKTRTANAKAAGGGGGGAGGGLGKHAPLTEAELYNQLQMDAFNDTALSPCPHCGRTFLPDRLQIHLRSCKPGSTARPVRAAAVAATTPTVTTTATATAAAAAPAAATSPPPKERPIRAAGVYKVPANAGVDDVPPGAAPARRQSTHVAAEYAFPVEEEEEDRAPPPANAASPLTPSRGTNGATAHARGLRPTNGAAVAAAAKSHDSDGDTDNDIEVIELEVQSQETRPPSPRAATEHRLSSVAMTGADAEMLGSSAPNRPASMEPSAIPPPPSPPSLNGDGVKGGGGASTTTPAPALPSHGRDRSAGSRPRRPSTASASNTTNDGEQVQEAEESARPSCGVQRRSSTAEVSEPARGSDADGECDTAKKIPLNNVSRFKNVQSRLKLQRQSAEVSLTPCRHCGRTFVPDRVQKHEECCVDRHKPPAAAAPRPSTGAATPRRAKPQSGAAAAAPSGAAAAAAPSTSAASTGKVKFCGGCGGKVTGAEQRFCTECGHKL